MLEPTTADIVTAQELHQQMVVVDAHHDIALDVVHRRGLGERGTLSGPWGEMLRTGGVNVQILPLFVEDSLLPELGLRTLFQELEAIRGDLEEDDSLMRLATNIVGIDGALAEGRIAGVLALEGCDGLSGDPAMLRVLYRLGVRMVSFTWNRRNEFSDGLAEGDGAAGLTRAGKIALRDMNEQHILCDVSHLTESAFWDVARLCQGPFIASHSNARAVHDHPRNLTDEQLRAVASSGGVVGLNFFGGFVDPENPTASRLVDHLSHIADTVGIEYVGIGSDFLEDWLLEMTRDISSDTLVDPAVLDLWIPDCRRSDQLPRFTAELLARGFGEDDIKKVLGSNFMRVFRQVWT